ncbi:hypothetical protein Tco_0597963 [Tanacetum coccineum]
MECLVTRLDMVLEFWKFMAMVVVCSGSMCRSTGLRCKVAEDGSGGMGDEMGFAEHGLGRVGVEGGDRFCGGVVEGVGKDVDGGWGGDWWGLVADSILRRIKAEADDDEEMAPKVEQSEGKKDKKKRDKKKKEVVDEEVEVS